MKGYCVGKSSRQLPETVIATVGTSLFYPNISSIDPEVQYRKEPTDALGLADRAVLQRYGLLDDGKRLEDILLAIKGHFDRQQWGLLAKDLLLLPPELRLCGAEINSTFAMKAKGFLSDRLQRLILLTSDTPDGEAIGQTLSAYFLSKESEIRFKQCDVRKVPGLQDSKPVLFYREGLPNLVRILGSLLRGLSGSPTAINATGGYKAQIAFAVAFGQATRLPVYYKHERFDQIVRFPSIPFTMDLSPIADHLKLWADLAEPGRSWSSEELDRMMPRDESYRELVGPLIESIEEQDETLYALSSLGLVYWEAFLLQNLDVCLRPKQPKSRIGCRFRDDHYPIGFKEYVEKVYREHGFISECHSLPYHGQQAISSTTFILRDERIIGHYVDRNNFGARFEVLTTASNELERRWVLKELNNFRL